LLGGQGRLDGRVAIVTGAASGLGWACAELFAAEGAALVCADRDAEGAEATAAAIGVAGGRAIAVACDVGSQADTETMASAALREFGGIDVLLANAGVSGAGTAIEIELETWERTLRTNLTGVWLSARAVLPQMVAQGHGSIVNQASISALVGVEKLAAYSAAKGGIVALTRQMAVDYAADQVRVNAICPGMILTPLARSTVAKRGDLSGGAEGDSDPLASRYPLGRLGTERDIAELALFLASDAAGWITGSVYTVDGGLTARAW
jgi:NAD(P)-dependent dehydrogenase (short-subunit alcohol dehydrogenase family)